LAKTIVTHISPDFDGIPGIWLLKRFHPDFLHAKLDFVPAGSKLGDDPVDSNPDIIHVDTGGGRFDHHDTSDFTCGAKLVYEWLVEEGYIEKDDEAMRRMMEIITEIDHGYDNYRWSDAANDRYQFMFHNILYGLKVVNSGDNLDKVIETTMDSLDGIYKVMQFKVKADEEIKKGYEFNTKWGRGIARETGNSMFLENAIKQGYAVALSKDPKKGNVRVTGSNSKNVDFTEVYNTLTKSDPEATWFLHASKVLLRNGSSRNPTMKATSLSLEDMIKKLSE